MMGQSRSMNSLTYARGEVDLVYARQGAKPAKGTELENDGLVEHFFAGCRGVTIRRQ